MATSTLGNASPHTSSYPNPKKPFPFLVTSRESRFLLGHESKWDTGIAEKT
jgi:hypothetical protein